jgi:hypothetical protein
LVIGRLIKTKNKEGQKTLLQFSGPGIFLYLLFS